MTPSNERLNADDLTIAQANLGLVEELELVVIDSPLQLGLQYPATLQLLYEGRPVADVRSASLLLCVIERQIGFGKEPFDILSVSGMDG